MRYNIALIIAISPALKIGRKTLHFLSKPLLAFVKYRRKLANAQTVRRILNSSFAKFAENVELAPTIFLCGAIAKKYICLTLAPNGSWMQK